MPPGTGLPLLAGRTTAAAVGNVAEVVNAARATQAQPTPTGGGTASKGTDGATRADVVAAATVRRIAIGIDTTIATQGRPFWAAVVERPFWLHAAASTKGTGCGTEKQSGNRCTANRKERCLRRSRIHCHFRAGLKVVPHPFLKSGLAG